MYSHNIPDYTSRTDAAASPTHAPSSPTYAPSSPLSEPSTTPPAPALRPATPHHLSEPIVIDSDDDEISTTDTVADSPPPQLCGPSATPQANFGFTQLRRALESHVTTSAKDREKAYRTSSAEMMHPQDRSPGLPRLIALPTPQPAIQTILLLSVFPGTALEHHHMRHLAHRFCAAHPDWEVLDLYGHLATSIQNPDIAAQAKQNVRPLDLYTLKRTLQDQTGVSGELGRRVLERLLGEKVTADGRGGRKFVVLGLGLKDEEAVRGWRREVNEPQAVIACLQEHIFNSQGVFQKARISMGEHTVVIPLLADLEKNFTALHRAIMERVYDDGIVYTTTRVHAGEPWPVFT
ncbi:hypothetical protein LTR95_002712 [Oleoguttula sp. CCFEE 5521]